jgi:hypothetical protein
VQRTGESALGVAAIEIVGGLERVGIGHHDRVETSAPLVVRVDPGQILLDQRSPGR